MGIVRFNKKPKSINLIKNINSNGTYTYNPKDEGVDYYKEANLSINVKPTLQSYPIQIINKNNDTKNIKYDTKNYDGLDNITIKAEIPTIVKNITENGTYNPQDDGVELYESVNVNIAMVDKYITENGVYDPTEDEVSGYSKIYVDVEGGGGEEKPYASAKEHKIIIVDFDGTELYVGGGYEGDEITLPSPPSHNGLIFDRWVCGEPITNNKIIVDKQDVVVMPTYHTSSGKTEITYQVRFDDVKVSAPSGLGFPYANARIMITCNGKQNITIDWGDGSEPQTVTSSSTYNFYHWYEDKEEHIVTIDSDGNYYFNSTSTFGGTTADTTTNIAQHVKKVRLASKCTRISTSAFRYCKFLQDVSIPKDLEFYSTYIFADCPSLKAMVIPKYASGTAYLGYAFYNCYSLKYVVFDSSIKNLAQNNFYNTYTLKAITLPYDLKTMGAYQFYYCSSLHSIYIKEGLNIGANTNCFYYCRGLEELIIPSSTDAVPANFISYASSIRKITFLGNITSIGSAAFGTCNALSEIDFSNCTQVPTLSAATALTTGALGGRKIYVPASLYDEWRSESNWVTAAIQRQLIPVEGK